MRLSIITINRNNAEGLKRTLDSVKAQTCQEFEHIIVDGASTDDSVKIIESFVRDVSCMMYDVLWVSEPDTGIYNAMNKGLKMAHGEYTLMLNSGDFLVDEHVIERIIPELHTEDLIQGNIIENYPNCTMRIRGYGRSKISFIDAMDAHFLHQATFMRLSLMVKYGYYDDSYKKGADTYFFTKVLALGNASFRYVDIDITNFDINGISSLKDPIWCQIDSDEDARWYGENISNRLWEFYKTVPKKIHLYDQLHKFKFIWFITMGLVRVTEWISPSSTNLKKEKI